MTTSSRHNSSDAVVVLRAHEQVVNPRECFLCCWDKINVVYRYIDDNMGVKGEERVDRRQTERLWTMLLRSHFVRYCPIQTKSLVVCYPVRSWYCYLLCSHWVMVCAASLSPWRKPSHLCIVVIFRGDYHGPMIVVREQRRVLSSLSGWAVSIRTRTGPNVLMGQVKKPDETRYNLSSTAGATIHFWSNSSCI